MDRDVTGERLLRLREVMRKTGMGRSTIYRKMDQGEFPRPVRISPSMVRWRESEIEQWIAALAQEGCMIEQANSGAA